MKLLYDLTATQPSPESKFHGGGAYGEVVFFKLLEYLGKIDMFCVYDAGSYINPEIRREIQERGIPLFDIRKTSLLSIIKENGIERAYSAMLNLNQQWPLDDVAVYTTVHGLRTLEMPVDSIMLPYARSIKQKIKDILFMTVARKFYVKKLYAINGRILHDKRIHVITVSRHSLASMKAFYPELQDSPIPVFASPTFAQLDRPASDVPRQNNTVLADMGLERRRFFLLTSAARWTKNALRAVQALDDLFSSGMAGTYKAVLTGVTRKQIFTKGLRNPSRFVFLDYVDRPLLTALNREQYAFIYPSLNEGFGYPPLEAMRYGIPVAASGSSSIPEVCGDAALYFDPYSVSEIKNRLVQLLDAAIYAEYARKAVERYEIVSTKQKEDLEKLAQYITGGNAE